jgi:hypothetical protein
MFSQLWPDCSLTVTLAQLPPSATKSEVAEGGSMKPLKVD